MTSLDKKGLTKKWQKGTLVFTDVSGKETLQSEGFFKFAKNRNYSYVLRYGAGEKVITQLERVKNFSPEIVKIEKVTKQKKVYIMKTIPCLCHEGCTRRRNPATEVLHGRGKLAKYHGCVCDTCNSPRKIIHGTFQAYDRKNGIGCRCEVCVRFVANYRKKRRYAEMGVPLPTDWDVVRYCDCHEGCEIKLTANVRKNPIKHGSNLYKNHGCRCDVCIASQTPCNCNPNCKVKKTNYRGGVSIVKHGTRQTYTHHRCRCDKCRASNREHQKNRHANMKKRWEEGSVPELNHGSANAYGNWGCRCDVCKKAHGARCVEYARRRREVENVLDTLVSDK
jgi:hypothetical protein